jgi:hypothetical protein
MKAAHGNLWFEAKPQPSGDEHSDRLEYIYDFYMLDRHETVLTCI